MLFLFLDRDEQIISTINFKSSTLTTSYVLELIKAIKQTVALWTLQKQIKTLTFHSPARKSDHRWEELLTRLWHPWTFSAAKLSPWSCFYLSIYLWREDPLGRARLWRRTLLKAGVGSLLKVRWFSSVHCLHGSSMFSSTPPPGSRMWPCGFSRFPVPFQELGSQA